MLEFVHPGSSMFILWNPHQNFASKNSSLNRELMSSFNNTCLIMSLSLKNPWRHLMSRGFASILCGYIPSIPLVRSTFLPKRVVAHGLASGRRKTRFCERLRLLAAKLKVEFLNGFIWWTFLLWSGLCHRVPFFVLKKVAFSPGPRSPPRATTHNLKLAFQLAVLKNTKLPVDPVESFTHSTAAPLQ